jgi:hypothetical protein
LSSLSLPEPASLVSARAGGVGDEKPAVQPDDVWKVGAIAPGSIAAIAIEGQTPGIED